MRPALPAFSGYTVSMEREDGYAKPVNLSTPD
jgi:hypothetical protein